MSLSFRDSLTGRLESLAAPARRPLAIYVCGPTVYAGAHVGHARTYLYFDVIRRYLRHRKIPARLVMNITDFEDKITARAMALGIPWQTLALREERRFVSSMKALRIVPPDVNPRSSAFVPAMIRLIRALERTGNVYRESDSLYYRVPEHLDGGNFPVGGELVRHMVPEPGIPLPTADSVSTDFLLWRCQEAPAPSWPSAWGRGAPGWHLECYAMAERHLGVPVDLHGGGYDLVFPHHYSENVIALTLRNRLFSRQFLHTAFVTQSARKMSKSVGNLRLVPDAVEEVGPDAVRWFLLSWPYHSRLEWDDAAARRAAGRLDELRARVRGSVAAGAGGTVSMDRLRALPVLVADAIGTELGVDRALRVVSSWGDELGRAAVPRVPSGSRGEARAIYREVEALLGVVLTRDPRDRRSG